jgi:4-hydroxy-tetrahydrodipicolinate reductase
VSGAISVALVGADGRMGQRLAALIAESSEIHVTARIERDALALDEISPATVDVVIDFSATTQVAATVQWCQHHTIPLVLGTTGLDTDAWRLVDAAATTVPIVAAPNFSVGVNALFALAGELARMVGPDFDLELVEAHHRHKVDAPSGTAVRLLEVLSEARKDAVTRCGREGLVGPRTDEEIGVSVVRGGDVVGEHTVLYLGQGEQVHLSHRATDRDIFARGALRAARWLVQGERAARRYDMGDVLKTP